MIDVASERIFIPYSHLKSERGWTDKLISEFLGDPDKLATNPSRRSGPKMKLFDLARVELTEFEPAFREAYESARKRSIRASAAGTNVANQKRESLVIAINALPLEIPRYEPSEVLKAAINHYNSLWMSRDKHKIADLNSDPDFLNRITINFIRHNLVNYDQACNSLKGRIGRQEAYACLKSRVVELIQDVYPEFASTA
jgi:hypothetical protein